MDDLLWQSATHIASVLRARQVSAVELLDAVLRRMEAANPHLNFLGAVDRDGARTTAVASDRRLKADDARPLEGLPVAVKDLTPTRGLLTTMGSKVYRDAMPANDAVVVERLRAAGAIVIAKTTTSEFANASVTDSPLFGATRNPWNPSRTSGGSSGGSAVAVATGCVPMAEGSDMGGSVRIPASFCGLVGLKPAFGRIPFGFLPSLFDPLAHHGPICRHVGDAALFLSVTAGPDDRDPLSLPATQVIPSLHGDVRGLRVGFSRDFGFMSVDEDILACFDSVLQELEARGAVVEDADLTLNEDLYHAGYRIFAAGITAYHGHLEAKHKASLDPTLLRFFSIGRALSATDLVDADLVRSRHWGAMRAVFQRHDVLICPTMPRVAPALGRDEFDFSGRDENGRSIHFDMTLPFNLFGSLPAVTIPAGLGAGGMPVGVQIVARRYDEWRALNAASALHNAEDWTRRLRALTGE